MTERYLPESEYPDYFAKLGGLRSRIAGDLIVDRDALILDLGTGSGHFAVEVARTEESARIIGIDIIERDVDEARQIALSAGMAARLSFVLTDATRMAFPPKTFDMVVNFLGLEDIHMTRGRKGVMRTFFEVRRVLRPGGRFCLVTMPPDEMETDAQSIEVALFSHVCGATWLSSAEYRNLLDGAGLRLTGKESYRTGYKLTAPQAREEIEYACDNVPRIYGVRTPTSRKVWEKFGDNIERKGFGHYSKVVMFTAEMPST